MISYEDGLVVDALVDSPHSVSRALALSWPVDTENKDATVRLENRRLAMEKAREEKLNYFADLGASSDPTEWETDSDSTETGSSSSVELDSNSNSIDLDSDPDSAESETRGSIDLSSFSATESKNSASTGPQPSHSIELDSLGSKESTSEYIRFVEMLRNTWLDIVSNPNCKANIENLEIAMMERWAPASRK